LPKILLAIDGSEDARLELYAAKRPVPVYPRSEG
jgi:hypothetical protein